MRKGFVWGFTLAISAVLCIAAGRISEMTRHHGWLPDTLVEVSTNAGGTYASRSMALSELFSNAVITSPTLRGTLSGGTIDATNAQSVFYAPVLSPDFNLTNYSLNASNAEYIINATNAVEITGFTFDSTANFTRFIGVTVTNNSGSDQTLRVNVNSSTLKWLGASPSRITNGYVARLAFQFLGNPNGIVIGAFRHEGN